MIWIGSLTLAGYWFGNQPVVKDNLSLAILTIAVVSLMPAFIGLVKHLRTKGLGARG